MWLLHLFLTAFIHAEAPSVSIDHLTLEQKVGQMFLFGFPGKEMTPKLRSHIQELKPGALIVFGRNISTLSQITKLNSDLQSAAIEASGVPLLLAIDQEGGAVARIKTSPALPSAYTIGNTNDPTLAFQAGKVTGELLNLIGFNVNLAPVLDVTDVRLTSFIGTRGFSDSPHKISSMGLAFAQGLAEGKVMPVAKHFPGHGPIALDTHKTTPTRHTTYESLLHGDLVPFVQYSNSAMPSGLMVAHIAFPQIDKSGLPATFSKKMISDVLLKELDYKGLVITDDIEMAGAAAFKNIEDRAVAAVKAGNDLIMVGWSPKEQAKAVAGVLKAVKKGVLTEERINASVKKILSHKAVYMPKGIRAPAGVPELKTELKKIQYASVFSDIIARYFKNLSGLGAQGGTFDRFVVVSSNKNFGRSFVRVIKNPNVSTPASLREGTMTPTSLLVYHIHNSASLRELRSLPANLRKHTLVINSHPKIRLEDKTPFIDVIETHSFHPNLGGYAADAINKVQRRISSSTRSF